MSQPKSDAEQKAQAERFLATARQLECDEDEGAFDEKLKAVVRPKTETVPPDKISDDR